jgi:hypothetical protein
LPARHCYALGLLDVDVGLRHFFDTIDQGRLVDLIAEDISDGQFV